MGVPLLDQVRLEHIWRVQNRHLRCIQDMPGVQLYTEVGTTTTKGGVTLTRYLCQRVNTPGIFPLPPEQVHSRLLSFLYDFKLT